MDMGWKRYCWVQGLKKSQFILQCPTILWGRYFSGNFMDPGSLSTFVKGRGFRVLTLLRMCDKLFLSFNKAFLCPVLQFLQFFYFGTHTGETHLKMCNGYLASQMFYRSKFDEGVRIHLQDPHPTPHRVRVQRAHIWPWGQISFPYQYLRRSCHIYHIFVHSQCVMSSCHQI